MAQTTEQRLTALRFDVNRSIRYHNRRRAFYDRFNDASTVFAVVFGSVAVFLLFKELELSTVAKAVPAALVTLFSSLNLVMGSTRMARLHHDLARRFIALERTLTLTPPSDDASLARHEAERLSIEEEEPPVLRVLDTLCYNDTLRAMGYPSSRQVAVKWYQRLCAQFFDLRQDALGRQG